MHLAILAAALLSISSCGSDKGSEPAAEASFTISPEKIELDSKQQLSQVTITGTDDWSIYSDQSWCTVSPSGGVKNVPITIKLNVTANTSTEARVANLTLKSGATRKTFTVTQDCPDAVIIDLSSINIGALAQSASIKISSTVNWTIKTDNSWMTLSPTSGTAGTTTVNINVPKNSDATTRTGNITITAGSAVKTVSVTQLTDAIQTPAGYTLVWNDEFNGASKELDSSAWSYETGNGGWGNNEIQNYVSGSECATVGDGLLRIVAKKSGTQVLSARVNTIKAWKYGYFEARMKLPKGIGTWPAFWMMPKNYTAWPADGEIDIMEEVGYKPNYVSSTIHCTSYNHILGTQKTAEKLIETAQSEYHVYALEWTSTYIKTYVDGNLLFTFMNDGKGDKSTWPFNAEFYLKLNLAWGGNWGGAQGVDEKALPATFEIDYVRVFQKQ